MSLYKKRRKKEIDIHGKKALEKWRQTLSYDTAAKEPLEARRDKEVYFSTAFMEDMTHLIFWF